MAKKNGHDKDDAAFTKGTAVETVLDAEVGRPVPKASQLLAQEFGKLQGSHGRKSYVWYKSKPWDDWWDEFATATLNTGRLKYRTAWAFCKAKAKRGWERDLLWEMIGPAPPDQKTQRAPWLGDWQKRRHLGFWSIDPERMRDIKAVIKERQDSIEACRSITPLMLPHMQRWHKLTEQVDEAFGGQAYLPNLAPDHPKNVRRFNAYVTAVKAAVECEKDLWEMWMKAHGLNPNDATSWVTMMGLVGQVGAKSALAGAALGMQAGLQLNPVDAADLAFVQDLREKAEMYPGLTPPGMAKKLKEAKVSKPV